MTPKEARERLITARVDLEILAEWLTETDRPGSGDQVQKDLLGIVDAISTMLPAYREALAVVERVETALAAATIQYADETLTWQEHLRALTDKKSLETLLGPQPEAEYVPGADSPRGEFG